ncbi:MAG: ribosome-recycling factor [Candidatus Westeberhardia cardiocondylae]|nr:ribosome-recycling factor [Candidatus Westeberhardia cardiocondylae]
MKNIHNTKSITIKITEKTKNKIQECINKFEKNIKKIRDYNISPNLIDNILIQYHNTLQPLQKLAYITNENKNTLTIIAFEKTTISSIKKAIISSNLGINPYSIGEKIYLSFPKITQENRKNLIKLTNIEAEKHKIQIRNIRRKINEKIKQYNKNKIINDDKKYKLQNIVQNITNKNIKKINKILKEKEKNLTKNS